MTVPVREMTVGSTGNSGTFTPARILSVVAVLVLVFIIFAPQDNTDQAAAYSSYAAGSGGTRALYDVLGRLGFSVSRNDKPLTSSPDSASAYVLIEPAQPLTAIEQAQLLAAVRNGAILIFTANDGELTDSLGFDLTLPENGFFTLRRTSVAGGNPPTPAMQDPHDAFQVVFPVSTVVKSKSRSGSQSFLWLDARLDTTAAPVDSAHAPALVLGHRVGRGYAIAVTPPQIVMNQLLREPRVAIAIVRALQFADTALGTQHRSRKVVFDEYHHGFGAHADMPAAVEHALTDTPLGRATIELIAAALVLLLAFGVRPLAPVPSSTVSRRSPLEHVGALAHAYSQVHARSLGANRLVRGLRRRHPLGLPRSASDLVYLSALRERIPAASVDVDYTLAALAPDSSDSSDHFATTGAAVANIERAFL